MTKQTHIYVTGFEKMWLSCAIINYNNNFNYLKYDISGSKRATHNLLQFCM